MKINQDLIAPCGLYCGVCAIYIAHRDNISHIVPAAQFLMNQCNGLDRCENSLESAP
jgi:hypothetical protein